MKIFLIRNEFDNGNGETASTIKPCATRKLAEQLIAPIIEAEINQFIADGTLVRNGDGTIKFADFVGDSYIEVTDTKR